MFVLEFRECNYIVHCVLNRCVGYVDACTFRREKRILVNKNNAQLRRRKVQFN